MNHRFIHLLAILFLLSGCGQMLPATDLPEAVALDTTAATPEPSPSEMPDQAAESLVPTEPALTAVQPTETPAVSPSPTRASAVGQFTLVADGKPASSSSEDTKLWATATTQTAATPGENRQTPSATSQPATPIPSVGQIAWTASAPSGRSVSLARIEDTDPAPPLAILVSTVRVLENGYYRVTGLVRNDGEVAYGGIGVVGTFFTEERPCRETQDHWGHTVQECPNNRFGPVSVNAACQVLAPGASCPFGLEIYPQPYIAYLLHPEGSPMGYRQPAGVTASVGGLATDNAGRVWIVGTVANPNPFPVNGVRVGGMLLDAAGEIVSVGAVAIAGHLAAGANASFELHLEYRPYRTYQIFSEAVQN